MIFLTTIRTRVSNRYQLFKARLSLRKMNDYEYFGRLMGLMMFPFALFGCAGYLTEYSNKRITSAVDVDAFFTGGYKRSN